MPKVGETRAAPCSWCGRPIVEVYLRYPPSSQIVGFYWDGSACSCINLLKTGLWSATGDMGRRRPKQEGTE